MEYDFQRPALGRLHVAWRLGDPALGHVFDDLSHFEGPVRRLRYGAENFRDFGLLAIARSSLHRLPAQTRHEGEEGPAVEDRADTRRPLRHFSRLLHASLHRDLFKVPEDVYLVWKQIRPRNILSRR